MTAVGDGNLDELFGEDEVRDREQLAGWRRVHAMVQDARAGGFDVEPPGRIDAILMAAARTHAPVKRGLWARVAAWFGPIVAHPALASAAMVVVVGGAAGVMYMRGQHRVVEPHVRVDPTPKPGHGGETRPDPVRELGPTTGGVVDLPVAPVLPAIDGKEDPERGLADHDHHVESAGHRLHHLSGMGSGSASGSGSDDSGETLPPPPPDVQEATGGGDGETTKDELEQPIGKKPPPADPRPDDDMRAGQIHGTGVQMQMAGDAATLEETRPGNIDPSITVSSEDRAADKTVKARAQSEQLAKQARSAARKRDCAAVRVMAKRVKSIDKPYYTSTFTRDREIKDCL